MEYTLHFDFSYDDWMMLFDGAWRTIIFSIGSMVIGLAVGVACAIARVSGGVTARAVAGTYVEFIRNTPILVQLLLIYFGLPSLGLRLSADTAAMIALIFNFGAYAAEIVRAGIEAMPRGQIEAAQALGMTRWEIYRYIVILPAIERVYPALASQFTLLMLGSSIISAIGASELTSAANSVQSQNFRSFEVYLVAGGMYLVLTLMMRLIFSNVALLLFPRRRAIGLATQQVA